MDKKDVLRYLRVLSELIESDRIRAADIADLPVGDVLELAEAEAAANLEAAARLKKLEN